MEEFINPATYISTWKEGGWVMIPLFLVTVYLYHQASTLLIYLKKARIQKIPRRIWARWIASPAEGVGHIGEVIRYVVADGYGSEAVLNRIEQVKLQIIPEVNQKIILLSVLVTVSPLMGLLGTVVGMLTTFKGLAAATGQTVDLVAEGIRVALITTQTGLMIAIPGYIFISMIIRRRNEYSAFLAQVENLAIQEGVHMAAEEETRETT